MEGLIIIDVNIGQGIYHYEVYQQYCLHGILDSKSLFLIDDIYIFECLSITFNEKNYSGNKMKLKIQYVENRKRLLME